MYAQSEDTWVPSPPALKFLPKSYPWQIRARSEPENSFDA
jgi:hypothetical protein